MLKTFFGTKQMLMPFDTCLILWWFLWAVVGCCYISCCCFESSQTQKAYFERAKLTAVGFSRYSIVNIPQAFYSTIACFQSRILDKQLGCIHTKTCRLCRKMIFYLQLLNIIYTLLGHPVMTIASNKTIFWGSTFQQYPKPYYNEQRHVLLSVSCIISHDTRR